MTILEIALPTPLRRRFDYLAPAAVNGELQAGMRVRVPFGRQQLIGLLLACKDSSELPASKLKPALDILDSEPLIDPELLSLCLWAADYYQCPIGDALQAALPTLLRQGEAASITREQVYQLSASGKGLPEGALKRAPKQAELIASLQQHDYLRPSDLAAIGISRAVVKQLLDKSLIETRPLELDANQNQPRLREQPLTLNDEQQAALAQIAPQGFHSYLLDGATGSGKTEVYLQAIDKVLALGKQALVLVPEIGLTPQTLARFHRRFAVPIVALHSSLNDRERLDAWLQAREGYARIIIGTRSAIFTPLAKPGIIVIDEEHDGSLKQQDGFRYSARDLALVRAQRLNIPVILGTATPSLESLHNAQSGRYSHLQLHQRAGNAQAPQLQLVDIRQQPLLEGFAQESLAAIRSTLQAGNQVLVFLNRRGYAPALECHSCGWLAQCSHCDARLTLHQRPRHLHCHHCGHQRGVPHSCPSCRSPQLFPLGQGTERSEELLCQQFPEVPVIRVDRDSTRNKNALQALLADVHTGAPCILVGTQMLAKGHHFPDVTLVLVIDADAGLFSTDFRSPERMGQLLLQVAGRAGRASKPGQVLIQSYHCDHPLQQTLVKRGYHALAQQLLHERQLTQMPPYRYLALLRAESSKPELAMAFLQHARQLAEQWLPASPLLSYLGPLPALMEKRGDRFRYQLQFNAAQRNQLQPLLRQLALALEADSRSAKLRWALDVDPLEM